MWLIILLLAIIVMVILYGVVIVKENTVYVVENFGKFSRIMPAGLHFRIPVLEEIVEQITLKQQNFSETGRYHTKDNLTVDIAINMIFQVIPSPEGVRSFTYTLVEREKTIAKTLEDALRVSIAKETFNDVLEKKQALVKEVWDGLNQQFKDWGIDIVSFQITGVRSVQTY